MKNYTRINRENRFEIYELKMMGIGVRQTALKLHKCPSTISREIRRNSGGKGYRPDQADNKALTRKKTANKAKKMVPELIEIIEKMLRDDWSPEQISGFLKKRISLERIYQHIWMNKKNGGDLYRHLRQPTERKHRKRGLREKRGIIRNKVSIHDRDEIVNTKGRYGDWEVDLVVGENHKGFIVTLVERVSKFMLAAKIESKHAMIVSEAVINMLTPFKKLVHTITSDNGKEFALHELIAQELGAKFYFADPYASWQRGLNENTNGLLRQYVPKKANLDRFSELDIRCFQNRLNKRPRKGLGFASPFQVFTAECEKIRIMC